MKRSLQLLSILLVFALLLPAVFASAEDTSESVFLRKTVTKADAGVDYTEKTFTFLFESCDTNAPIMDGYVLPTKIAEIPFRTITVAPQALSEITVEEDISQGTGSILSVLKENGTYAWQVSEQNDASAISVPEHMEYDNNTYYLVAYVTDAAKGDAVFSIWNRNSLGEWDKVEKLDFTNVYNRDIVPEVPTNPDLKITNQVVKTDRTTRIPDVSFDYLLNIGIPGGAEFPKDTYSYKINGGEERQQKYGENLSFSLKDGETVEINGLYEGAVYSVIQSGKGGYTPEAAFGAIGGTPKTVKDSMGNDLVVMDDLSPIRVPNKGGQVVFTNVKDDATPTMFMIDNLPYIALVAVAVCGILVYFASRKRRHSEDD